MSVSRCCLPLVITLSLLLSWSNATAQPSEAREKYLSKDEVFKKFDQNGDGELSPQERRTMVVEIAAGRVNVPPAIQERFREQEARLKEREQPQPQRPASARPGQRPGPRMPEGVELQRDVVYGDAGNRPLKLDLVLPKQQSDKPLPLVVFIHGGGWRGGDKAGGMGRVAPFVATGNYVGASVGYRLSGEAIWPAQIHDCKAAIRWLRANAEKYNIDPERIGVWGSSAGGHLVNMLGTSGDVEQLEGNCGSPGESSRVSCVVPFCGPTNFLAPKKFEGGRRPSAVDLLLGGMIEEKQELAANASPITYVSKDDPPFLIVHGTSDGTVPLEQAEMFHKALEEAGVDVTFVRIIGGGHGIGGEEVQKRVNAFFEKHLRGQDVEVSDEPIEAPER